MIKYLQREEAYYPHISCCHLYTRVPFLQLYTALLRLTVDFLDVDNSEGSKSNTKAHSVCECVNVGLCVCVYVWGLVKQRERQETRQLPSFNAWPPPNSPLGVTQSVWHTYTHIVSMDIHRWDHSWWDHRISLYISHLVSLSLSHPLFNISENNFINMITKHFTGKRKSLSVFSTPLSFHSFETQTYQIKQIWYYSYAQWKKLNQ